MAPTPTPTPNSTPTLPLNGNQASSLSSLGKILVTGGAGYIGSHAVVQLLEAGYQVVVLDNLHNSTKVVDETGKPESLVRAEKLASATDGRLRTCEFVLGDLLDREILTKLFTAHKFESVIHFAAYKSVGASCVSPLAYYRNNITGSLNLLETMSAFGVKRLVFSSSSTVYGPPSYLPLDEGHPTGNCTNPYGRSKYMMELMIQDVCRADAEWRAVILRYFNPIGADPSGEIGEDPPGVPRNLVPYICQTLVGRKGMESVPVYGTNYETRDGTAIRGYIHVMDVVRGHLAALKRLEGPVSAGARVGVESQNWSVYNLGMGKGHSVLDIMAEFERASGREVPWRPEGRRQGDVKESYADCTKAEVELGWKPEKSLTDMVRDTWRWQELNPNGYGLVAKIKAADE